MEQIRLGKNDILVSFDVVSLFTNVPVEEACNIAKERLLSDITLSQRTNLSPENVHDLLKLCLTARHVFNCGRNSMNKQTALQWVVHCRLLWLVCSWRNLKRRS